VLTEPGSGGRFAASALPDSLDPDPIPESEMIDAFVLTMAREPFRCDFCARPRAGLLAFASAELGTAFGDYARFAPTFVIDKIESNLADRADAVDLDVIRREAKPSDPYSFDRLVASLRSANDQLNDTRLRDESWGPADVLALVSVVAILVEGEAAGVAHVGGGVIASLIRRARVTTLNVERPATDARDRSLGQRPDVEVVTGRLALEDDDLLLLGVRAFSSERYPSLYEKVLSILTSASLMGDALVRVFGELKDGAGPLLLAHYHR
jgi:hypothetical protein